MNKAFAIRLVCAAAAVCLVAGAAVNICLSLRPGTAARVRVPGRNIATLVLDPGHGGADGGAVSVTGTSESAINMEIAERCRTLAALFGVTAEMTRDSEELQYPEDASTIRAKKVWDTKNRTQFINSTENAVLISIHQNKYTTAGPHGCQVLYAPTPGSRELAESLQGLLRQAAGEDKRNAALIGEGIYIMNHVTCPAVLVECGFVSNAVEAKRLEDPRYQLKLAAMIVGGYLESIS